MKILIALFALTVSVVVAAPKKWPDIPYAHVVAYCYDFTQDERGTSIAYPDGSLHKGIINATTVRLADHQIKGLIQLLTKDVHYERAEVECYDPHHAFVFYDANWKILASIEICFLCEDYRTTLKGVSSLLDLPALEVFTRNIGLPMYEKSAEYTKLFLQQQAPKNPKGKAEQKQKGDDSLDPFGDSE